MSTNQRELSLNAFYAGTGHHEASWRVPGPPLDKTLNLQSVIDVAKLAEHAKLDAFFLADTQGGGGRFKAFEPFTLLSALAVHTKNIGLIATVHTTYNEPFHVARKFASLDHISKGRAGWNMVTGGVEGSENFNRRNQTRFEERYDIAEEFIEEESTRILSHSELRDLQAAGLRLESLFGRPQDVEWCIRARDLFLLQSRPITTL